MVLQYTVCDVELPNPVKFTNTGFLQGFLDNLIPGLLYPIKLQYILENLLILFFNPVKSSIRKSVYLNERNNN